LTPSFFYIDALTNINMTLWISYFINSYHNKKPYK